MKTIDLNPELPAARKTAFFAWSNYNGAIGGVQLSEDDADYRVLTSDMFPGSVEDWTRSVWQRLEDALAADKETKK